MTKASKMDGPTRKMLGCGGKYLRGGGSRLELLEGEVLEGSVQILCVWKNLHFHNCTNGKEYEKMRTPLYITHQHAAGIRVTCSLVIFKEENANPQDSKEEECQLRRSHSQPLPDPTTAWLGR
ncbi:hypothetical protein E2C01_083735 [Portunus trituberculatus]|uniref:Uncharacterized protein n=1 Tax=Portunus trituberculatus TaxID=210409 RepID=A0A5B7J8T4_PORTR|nr:hypothetical protein [Portunus trituberculatus]